MATSTTVSNNVSTSSSSNKTTNLSSPPSTTDATLPMPTAERVMKSINKELKRKTKNEYVYFFSSHSMSTKCTFNSL